MNLKQETDSAPKSFYRSDMFRKILLAEDFDSYNLAVASAVENLGLPLPDHSAYCDEALLRLKKAFQDGDPYDLLISDLSFKPGVGTFRLRNGMELIEAAKAVDANLKVVVFSIENRLHPVKRLWTELEIDAFVLKGRNNIPEIQKAIRTVSQGERYLSDEIARNLQDQSLNEIDAFDIRLMKMLAEGLSQDDIVLVLRAEGIVPGSKSSVEKRLNRLKTSFGANTTVQMLLMAKDLGLV